MANLNKIFGLMSRAGEAPSADAAAPPGGSSPEYRNLPDDRLVRLLFTTADQLPLAAAQEVVARGGRLVAALCEIIDDGCNWHRLDAGWCAVAHAAYLLGAIADADATPALLHALDAADYWDNEMLKNDLPAIFGRIGPKSLAALRRMARDEEAAPSLRDGAMTSMAAVAQRHPNHAEEVFLFIASVAADPAEDREARAYAGCILLDCARREHEALLLSLVRSGVAANMFDADEVGRDIKEPHLTLYLHDWMDFYSPERALSRRSEREAGRLAEKAAFNEALDLEWGENPDVCPDDEGPEESGPGSRRRPFLVMEQISARFQRTVRDNNFKSVEEANAYYKTLGGALPPAPPANSWEKAQDLMYEAWQEESPRRREEMARSALAICPDCCDAYSLLAEETARTASEAAELYKKAVAAGERALGPDFFRENAGHFWGKIETRPYMRARAELASCLWTEGDFEAALRHYGELLRLNPRDGQGVRVVLLSCLGELDRFADIEELLSRPEHKDDDDLGWLLMKALTAFRQEGASARADALLRSALDCNEHLPDYLLGRKAAAYAGADGVRVGGEDEAAATARNFLSVWRRVPGALAWLAISAGVAQSASVGRNVPCPCGSGKKFKKCCLNRKPEGHA